MKKFIFASLLATASMFAAQTAPATNGSQTTTKSAKKHHHRAKKAKKAPAGTAATK